MPLPCERSLSHPVLFGVILMQTITPILWEHSPIQSALADEVADIEIRTETHESPYARYMAVSALDSKRHRMIVFGGRQPNGESTSDRLLALDLHRLEWTPILTEGASPAGTGGPGMVYVDREDALYLFGGWPLGGERPVGELWRLRLTDGETHKWERLAPDGRSPDPRNGMVMVYDQIGHRIILHGGDSWSDPDIGFKPMNDLWEYDLAKREWRILRPTGDIPAARWNHAAAVDRKARKMYLLGGAGRAVDKATVDLHLYELDLSKDSWRRLPVEGDIPVPLEGHSLTYDRSVHALLLAGGLSLADTGPAGPTELWSLDLASFEWSKTGGALRKTRRGHVAVYDPAGSRHILFGGETAVERGNFYVKGKPLENIVIVKLNKQ